MKCMPIVSITSIKNIALPADFAVGKAEERWMEDWDVCSADSIRVSIVHCSAARLADLWQQGLDSS